MGSNNLGRVEVSVGQTGKEATLNDSDAVLDGAISDDLTITWAGADALKTLTSAQLQSHIMFIMGGSTSEPAPVLKTADVQRGVIIVTNNLSVILTVTDYAENETVDVGVGLSVAILVTGTGVKAIFVPAASGGTGETLADGPGDYTGSALKLWRVNAAETGFEFLSPLDLELLNFKKACRAATTVNIVISTALNNGDSIDGVTLATGDRVLVKNQTSGAENGIYVVGVSPARATDFDASSEVKGGTIIAVSEGTVGGNSAYMLTTNDTITIAVTSLTFATFGGSAGAFINLSDVPGAYTSKAKYKVRVNAAATGLEFVSDTRNLMGSFGGAIPTSSVVFACLPMIPIDFAASMAGSRVFAKTAATAQTDFDLRKNGVSFGTIRFAAAGTVATYIGVAATSFDGVDDYLEILSPGSADATLQSLFFSLIATAND